MLVTTKWTSTRLLLFNGQGYLATLTLDLLLLVWLGRLLNDDCSKMLLQLAYKRKVEIVMTKR